MTQLESYYTDETITNSDGVKYSVLQTNKMREADFADQIEYGKKTKATRVRIAKPGEEIITVPGAIEEARYVAKGGEYIFVNELPGGKLDQYVPRDQHGIPNGMEVLAEEYSLIGGKIDEEGAIYIPSVSPSKILHEILSRPTVIKSAFGPDQHQFLASRATLRFHRDGKITGIDKTAFDETWSKTLCANISETDPL